MENKSSITAESEALHKADVSSSATPEIVNKLVEFFQFWQNPDRVEGDSLPIKEFQLQIYSPSYSFVFKWYVEKKDFEEAAKFIGIKLKKSQRTLQMSLGEYNIELAY